MLSHYPNDYSNMCYYSMMPWSYAGINWAFNPEKPVLQKIVSYQIMFKKTITQVCVTSPLCDLMLVSIDLLALKKTVFYKRSLPIKSFFRQLLKYVLLLHDALIFCLYQFTYWPWKKNVLQKIATFQIMFKKRFNVLTAYNKMHLGRRQTCWADDTQLLKLINNVFKKISLLLLHNYLLLARCDKNNECMVLCTDTY